MEQPNISGAVPADAVSLPLPPEETQGLPPELAADFAKGAEILTEDEPKWEPDPIPADPVTLSDGSQILFRQPDGISVKQIKPALRALQFGGVVDFCDQLAPVVIKSWNCKDYKGSPLKPPSINAEAMDMLKPNIWNELVRYLMLYKQHFDPPVPQNPTDG